MSKQGWTEVAPAILAKNDSSNGRITALMGTHVDDLLCAGNTPADLLMAVSKLFVIDTIVSFEQNKWMVYAGMDMKVDTDAILLGQNTYAQEQTTMLDSSDSLQRRRFSEQDLEMTPENEINVIYREAQQQWTGILGWLAHTQRQLSVVFSRISRNNTRPSKRSVVAAQRAVEYAKTNCKPLKFEVINEPVVVMWADANYETMKCESRIGWEVQLIEKKDMMLKPESYAKTNVVAWRSRRFDRKIASSTEAELVAQLEIAKLAPMYSSFIQRLWGAAPPVVCVTDSQPLMAWIESGTSRGDHGCQGRLDLLRQRLQIQGAITRWVPTKYQRADKHTKLVLAPSC